MRHDCQIADKLVQVHKWAHLIREAHTDEDMARVDLLADKLLALLNEQQECNGVKVLALFEVLGMGVDEMECEASGTSTTIH